MKSFAEYEALAEQAHGHMCAGQILGLRMAIHGMNLLQIEDPAGKDRKRLIAYVEIDRCATDAITVVTGCRMGKRALKFRDFGKMAATFCDLREGQSIRIAARESARARAKELVPVAANSNEQQMAAYRIMASEELFECRAVHVELGPQEFPGYKGERQVCSTCGEGINFDRHVVRDGVTLCKSCAGDRYYTPL